MCSLQECAYGGHIQFLNKILERGADVNEIDDRGRTALYEASKEGHLDILEALIKAGADVDQVPEDRNGKTALHIASFKGRTNIVESLLDAGADATILSDEDMDAFDYAKKKKTFRCT